MRSILAQVRYLCNPLLDVSPIILGTDEPVISLGGFEGRDPILSNERLAGLVDEGAVRFFMVQQKGEVDTGQL